MANWSAIIDSKDFIDKEGTLRIGFSVLRDEVIVSKGLSVDGQPSEIQQLIATKVKKFAPEWEVADSLEIGQELKIVFDGSETVK